MEALLSIPWPLQSTAEKAILEQCKKWVTEGTESVPLHCGDVLHPSTRFLTLLWDIARLSPRGETRWQLLEVSEAMSESLWLTGLDRWFHVIAEEEAIA